MALPHFRKRKIIKQPCRFRPLLRRLFARIRQHRRGHAGDHIMVFHKIIGLGVVPPIGHRAILHDAVERLFPLAVAQYHAQRARGADGIQLIGVKEQLCLNAVAFDLCPKAVGGNASGDLACKRLPKAVLYQKPLRLDRPRRRVAHRGIMHLLRLPHIVQKACGNEHLPVDVFFSLCQLQRQIQHPPHMQRVMRPIRHAGDHVIVQQLQLFLCQMIHPLCP